MRAIFEPFGNIKDIIIKTKQGSSNSYCFSEYENIESASKAQEEYNLCNADSKAKTSKAKSSRWSSAGEKEKLKIEDRNFDAMK